MTPTTEELRLSTWLGAQSGMVSISKVGNVGGPVLKMVRAIESSQVLTTSFAGHPNHLVGHHRTERGVQGNCDRQIKTF